MGFDLAGMIKEKIEELNHVGEKVAPKLNRLFLTSVNKSLGDFYGSYDPKMYKRTNNFMSVANSARTSGKGNTIIFTADSGSMGTYPGIYQPLSPSTAFDFMFMNGEHGHGRFYAASSIPPYQIIDDDIESMFGGLASDIIEETVSEILRN